MKLVYRFCLFVAHVKSWYPWQAQKFTCSEKRYTGRDCIVCSWYFLGIWMLTLHIPTAVHDCFPFAIQYCSFYSGVVSHKMMDLPRNAGLKTLYTHQHVRLVFCFQWFSLSLHSNLYYHRLQTSLEDCERRHWPSQLSVVKHLPIIPQQKTLRCFNGILIFWLLLQGVVAMCKHMQASNVDQTW